MFRYRTALIGLASCTVLTLALAANATACVSTDKKPKIKVSVVNGQPVVDKDTLRVCVGDEVHWVFAGSKEFKISFLQDQPFDWPDKSMKGASVKGQVRPDAVQNGKPTEFPYGVDVDGVMLDPKIIVDP